MARAKTKVTKKQKRPAGKTTSVKQTKNPKKAVTPAHEDEEIVSPLMAPGKPVFIAEETEAIIGVEEKVEEDGVPLTEDAEEEGEEATLDAEEINPFGDKWEE